jgi:hypothetical protein
MEIDLLLLAKTRFPDTKDIEFSRFRGEHLDFYKTKRFKKWVDFYNELDVTPFADYDALIIAVPAHLPYSRGGFTNTQLTFQSLQAGKFPYTHRQINLKSYGAYSACILTLLKIHHTYGTPIHEIMTSLHMNEFTLDQCHTDFLPDPERYFLYGNVKDERRPNAELFDLAQYQTQLFAVPVREKKHLYTYGKSTPIPVTVQDLMQLYASSKYHVCTPMEPAIAAMVPALAHGCLPLLGHLEDHAIKQVENTYQTCLRALRRIVAFEDDLEYHHHLERLTGALVPFRHDLKL